MDVLQKLRNGAWGQSVSGEALDEIERLNAALKTANEQAEGFERGLYLRSVKESGDAADQCRELGIAVGDTIIGRESGGGAHWHEARLTLLWLGETEAVWREQTRTNGRQDWSSPREAVNWTLECRHWRKTPNVPHERLV